MNNLTDCIYGVIPLDRGVQRLAISESEGGLTGEADPSIDWDEVKRVVQSVFDEMAGRVLRAWPVLSSRTGSVGARAFPLFVYCTFYAPDGSHLEPVVAGVTFGMGENKKSLVVRGDISGEETGCIHFDTDCDKVAPATTRDAIATGLDIARRLAEQEVVVAEELGVRNFPGSV